MFCPQCGAEYRDGITTCADCNIELVQEPTSQQKTKNVEFVELEEFFSTMNQGDIAFVKSILESEQIPYVVQGENFNRMRAPIPVRFLVPREKIELARELLKEFL